MQKILDLVGWTIFLNIFQFVVHTCWIKSVYLCAYQQWESKQKQCCTVIEILCCVFCTFIGVGKKWNIENTLALKYQSIKIVCSVSSTPNGWGRQYGFERITLESWSWDLSAMNSFVWTSLHLLRRKWESYKYFKMSMDELHHIATSTFHQNFINHNDHVTFGALCAIICYLCIVL